MLDVHGFLKAYIFIILFIYSDSLLAAANTNPPKVTNIGVLAIRGPEIALARWQATADYLSESIPGHKFNIVPYTLNNIANAIQKQKVDFVLTNTGNYVELEYYFGISRLATMKTFRKDKTYTQFGAVIFTRSDRKDIENLEDLKGKRFVAVSAEAFGGFQMAWQEFKLASIDPFSDFESINFVGLPHDNIVYSVIRGTADAGTVRGEVLERMIEERKIEVNAIRVLNKKNIQNYPFPVSTKLFPEWPMAKLKSTDDRLAQQVAIALLTLDENSKAAVISDTAGWTIPLNYKRVYALFEDLKIGPYENTGFPSVTEIVSEYWHIIGMSILVMISLMTSTGCVVRNNNKLVSSQDKLRKEVKERIRIEQELTEHKDSLEETVKQRTHELADVNEQLQKDINARKQVENNLRESESTLKKLYEVIASSKGNYKEKIKKILDIGCDFLKLPIGLYVCTRKGKESVLYSGSSRRSTGHSESLSDSSYLQQYWHDMHEPISSYVSIPEISIHIDSITKYKNCAYLFIPVVLMGKVSGYLEFRGKNIDRFEFSQVELDIVKLMARWISDEQERIESREKVELHQAELSHVTRLNSMGEMASSLAHELNQPLTAIINYTRGCLYRIERESAASNELAIAIENVHGEAERAAEIIKRLWELVRKGPSKQERICINDPIGVILKLIKPAIVRNNIVVECELENELPMVYVDRIQLEQVIMNLLLNSMEAMTDSDCATKKITISTKVSRCAVQVCIKDTGKGLKKELISKVFDPFFTTKEQGMGMGLSISRTIIEKHEGKIFVVDSNTSGSVIGFEIPHV